MAKLRDILTTALPGLSQSVVESVMLKLEDIGVETLYDLDLVQDSDLVPPLKLIHARKFVNKCKEEGRLAMATGVLVFHWNYGILKFEYGKWILLNELDIMIANSIIFIMMLSQSFYVLC